VRVEHTDTDREPFFDALESEAVTADLIGPLAVDRLADALVQTAGETVLERLAADWHLLRNHHPVGAYLPVGQLDGDCWCGRGAWPCETVRTALGLPPAEV